MSDRQLPTILVLGTTQTLAWASSYYLPAILAEPVARDLGVSTNWFFAAFSGSLIISAMLGPRVGRQIDLVGGRQVLSLSNVIFAAGLAILGTAHSVTLLVAAWVILGVGMGMGLYDAAFGALGRIYGSNARPAITGITLLAGFASTIGWPLSAWGVETIGWRETCYAWAAAHVLLGLPLNLICLPSVALSEVSAAEAVKPNIPMDRAMVLMAVAFAAAWTVTSAMAAHLPRILEAAGATTLQAVAAGAFIGPAQVLARIMEASLMRRLHPLTSTRLACITHPLGVALLFATSGTTSILFAIFHGAGNGILTIARGTLPLAVFGPKDFAYRLGVLGAPSRILQALAPLGFAFLIDWCGSGVLIVSSALSLLALLALSFIDRTDNRQATPSTGQ